ncbi:MAG: PAS domain S-box protein [Thermoguttaceae bacterium]|jgi:PAS domain S-box-containing protein
MSQRSRDFLLRYGAALLCALVAIAIRAILGGVLADRAPMTVFYVAVVLSAWFGGLGPALLALGLGFLAAAYFLFAATLSPGLPPTQAAVLLGLYLTVGAILAAVTHRLRRAGADARRRSTRLAAMQAELQTRMGRLAEAEQRVRAVVDHVIDGIIAINHHGQIESFNPAAERIFGYRAAEVIGRNVNMLMPEPHRSQHDGYVANYLRTGQAKIIGIGREVLGLRKDGSTFPMDLAVTEFQLEQRRTFVGLVRDVSERKRAEQTFRFLADASASLASLVDFQSTLEKVARMAVPLFADWCLVDMVGPDGGLHRMAAAHADPQKTQLAEDFNRRCPEEGKAVRGPGQVLRTGRSDLLTTISAANIGELAATEEQARFLQSLQIKSAMSVPLQVRGRILGVVTFMAAESAHHYQTADLGVAEDLAHRASLAIESARLYAEVKDADRRKDEFLAMLAHELRNPLAPIRNGLDLLDMEDLDAETAAWTRNMMKHQVQHMVRLVDDLLDVSRIMRGKIQLRKEPLLLADAVTRGIETAQPLIDAQQHQLEVHLPAEPLWIEADPVRIAQVVANLLNNAAKYSDKPGHIWVDLQRSGSLAVLRVRDDGLGIDPELLPQIFDLFTQADRSVARSRGGLGIGLTVVRSLVERHGGSVEALSAGPNQGSEFLVRLPALAGGASDAAAAQQQQSQQSGGETPRRVLVVDDNVAAARMLCEITTRWKFDVHVAHNGLAALEMARIYHPDIVLLDIGLPGMTGYEVAAELRRQPEFADILLVAVTGYGQEEDRRRSRAAGFNHHLVKPVQPDTLHDLLVLPGNSKV